MKTALQKTPQVK